MKKVLCMVLVLCMLLGAVPVLAEEATVKYYNDFVYVTEGDRNIIVGIDIPERRAEIVSNYDNEWAGRWEVQVTVPYSGDGVVFDLGKEAFRGEERIAKLIFSEGITVIPEGLCRDMPNLEEVVLPATVVEIGDYAFRDCAKLEKINIGAVDTIGEGAFDGTLVVEPVSATEATAENPDVEENEATEVESEIEAEMPVEDNITIMLNDKEVVTDMLPYIKNDRVMVPMRAIFEALGATVTWDDETKTAIGVKEKNIVFNEIEVKITIGESVIYRNGKAFEVDAPAEIVSGRTMVPLRAIVEAFAAVVNWEEKENSVEIFVFDPLKKHEIIRRWYDYDEEGRLLSWSASTGDWEWYTYDKNGNKIKNTSMVGYINYTYDENNNCIFYEDSYGFKIEYTYDENGNLIKERHFNEKYNSDYTYEYTYNEKGQETAKKYDDGSERRYTYDEEGNIIEENYSSGGWVKYTYDENNNLTYQVTDGRVWEKYEYDDAGRKIFYEFSEYNTKVTYEYNKEGLLIRQTDNDGDFTIFEYDEKGQMIYSEHHEAEK